MIRVLQGFIGNQYSGVSIYIYNNYKYINKEKVQFDFLCINSLPYFADECTKNGAKFYKIHKLRKWYRYIFDLYKVIKDNDYTVVHFNLSYAHIIPVLVARFAGVKSIYLHAHSTSIDYNSFVKRTILKIYHNISLFLLKYVSVENFFACSNKAGKFVFGNSITGNKKFVLLNNAIDLSRYKFVSENAKKIRENLQIEGETFVIGHVGRFSYQKNHEFLIEVFNSLLKYRDKSILVLVGVGEKEKYIHSLVRKYDIEEKVLFLGQRNDVPQLMQAMDCFVLPSRFEGLPIVGIEAQAAGLPCFFADTITDELKITELAQYLSLKDKPEEWAKKIMSVYNYKRLDMSVAIRKAGYDIKTEIKKIEDIYENLCE